MSPTPRPPRPWNHSSSGYSPSTDAGAAQVSDRAGGRLLVVVAVAQTRGIAPSLLVSPTEAVRTGPAPRYRWILVSPSAAGLDCRCRPLQRPGFVQQPPWKAAVPLPLSRSMVAVAQTRGIAPSLLV